MIKTANKKYLTSNITQIKKCNKFENLVYVYTDMFKYQLF